MVTSVVTVPNSEGGWGESAGELAQGRDPRAWCGQTHRLTYQRRRGECRGQCHRWTYWQHCRSLGTGGRTSGIGRMPGPRSSPTGGYPLKGDQPQNLRATDPSTSRHQPQNWTGSSLLFNPDGVLKFSLVGHILVLEAAGGLPQVYPRGVGGHWRGTKFTFLWYLLVLSAFVTLLVCFFLPCSGGTLRRTSEWLRAGTLDTSPCVSLALLPLGLSVRHSLRCNLDAQGSCPLVCGCSGKAALRVLRFLFLYSGGGGRGFAGLVHTPLRAVHLSTLNRSFSRGLFHFFFGALTRGTGEMTLAIGAHWQQALPWVRQALSTSPSVPFGILRYDPPFPHSGSTQLRVMEFSHLPGVRRVLPTAADCCPAAASFGRQSRVNEESTQVRKKVFTFKFNICTEKNLQRAAWCRRPSSDGARYPLSSPHAEGCRFQRSPTLTAPCSHLRLVCPLPCLCGETKERVVVHDLAGCCHTRGALVRPC